MMAPIQLAFARNAQITVHFLLKRHRKKALSMKHPRPKSLLLVTSTLALLFSSVLLSCFELSHLCHFEESGPQGLQGGEFQLHSRVGSSTPLHKHHACYLSSSFTLSIPVRASVAPVISTQELFAVLAAIPLKAFIFFFQLRAPPTLS